MGAAGTPYAHGAFVYDIFFEDKYPEGPPKVNLMTTGGGSVRFNPNLYNEGYVCLSLLGTWRGNNPTEGWSAKVSTLMQVLLSVQAIVMSNEVYFNEPGYEGQMGTPHGEALNNGYKNVVKWATVKYAILEQIRNPPRGFEEVIRMNYFLKKDMILAEIDEWLSVAKEEEVQWCGFNHAIESRFKQSKEKYHDELLGLKKDLVKEFEKMTSPWLT
jgi:hypothetical protein